MKKKLIAVFISGVLALSLTACGDSDSSSDSDANSATQTETVEKDNKGKKDVADEEKEKRDSDEVDDSADVSDDFSPIGDSLAIDFDIPRDPSDFPKDTTGKWRQLLIAESGIEFQYYALNYYERYFKSNDEVHVIYNFSTNTVTCITCMGNLLSVRIMDYVDKEEHDASIACSGTFLGEYHVNIDTGAIEKIQ